MLILRGLIVALGGFTFIFLPGVIISILTRRDLRFETNLLLWGMGVLVVALFPALFLTSLLRIIFFGDRLPETTELYAFSLLGSIVSAVFLECGKYLLLRWRQIPPSTLLNTGIMLGLGVGLLTNVFQGISLVGAGFRLLFGDTSIPELAKIASQAWLDLIAGLVALNVYRIALVAISAALGGLVARALITGRQRWLWLAVFINAVTAWSYNAIGLALGNESLLANGSAILYQGALAALALVWLGRTTSTVNRKSGVQPAGNISKEGET
jgi:hypothetical protein